MAKATRKGGLGKGLGALIPTAPAQKPRIGADAADIVFGKDTSASSLPSNHPLAGKQEGNSGVSEKGVEKRQDNRDEKAGKSEGSDSQSNSGAEQRNQPSEANEFGATYREIPIGEISPNPRQPRQVFDEEALEELVHSIKEFGLLQPIVVRTKKSGGYELIMGERRLRAATKAGLKTLPAIVRETEDSDMLRDALLENIHRAQLNPLEEAAAYQQLLDEFGVTQQELADRIGRSRPVITNMIRLLVLPVDVQRKVAAGVLSAGHARALLGLKAGAEAQEQLAKRVVAEGMSVRATEEAVVLMNRGEQPAPKKAQPKETPEFLSRAADKLGDNLDTKVTVSMGKRKGKIVVEFGDRDDFERIMGLIGGAN